MAGGTLNKVMLIGRLGKDPELSYTTSQRAVAKFSLATNETWKDRDGNQQESTDWHNIVVWDKLAEIASEWLKKGSHVYIEGRISTRSWDDSEGKKHYITEIVGTSLQMLGSKTSGGVPMPDDSDAPPQRRETHRPPESSPKTPKASSDEAPRTQRTEKDPETQEKGASDDLPF
ncbi:single-stranded DNA-binding protein [bacterium]|nr:single-stranded DNA-binding protein [bacterium]